MPHATLLFGLLRSLTQKGAPHAAQVTQALCIVMNYRKSEIEKLNLDVRWLDQEHSQHAYDFATKYSATDRYGLNSDTVSSIKRHEIESGSVAKNWLSNQLNPDGTV